MSCNFAWIMVISFYLLPFNAVLSFWKRKQPHGTKSGKQGKCGVLCYVVLCCVVLCCVVLCCETLEPAAISHVMLSTIFHFLLQPLPTLSHYL
jgi:hypothetical protein